MKKVIYILVLLFGLIIGCLLILFSSNYTNNEEKADFIFNGYDSVNINFKRDSIYADGVDPFGVYNRTNGIIQNETIAVEYAKLILFSIYGKTVIERERPYNVKMINEKIWSISGQLNKNTEGGTFSILINRIDGKVLYINHTK